MMDLLQSCPKSTAIVCFPFVTRSKIGAFNNIFLNDQFYCHIVTPIFGFILCFYALAFPLM